MLHYFYCWNLKKRGDNRFYLIIIFKKMFKRVCGKKEKGTLARKIILFCFSRLFYVKVNTFYLEVEWTFLRFNNSLTCSTHALSFLSFFIWILYLVFIFFIKQKLKLINKNRVWKSNGNDPRKREREYKMSSETSFFFSLCFAVRTLPSLKWEKIIFHFKVVSMFFRCTLHYLFFHTQ